MVAKDIDLGQGGAKVAGLAEFIVTHLHAPDLIVLEEIQDDNGEGPDPAGVVDASATAQRLTDAITAREGPSYAFVDVDPAWNQDGGAPGANIRVAFLYRTDRDITFTPRGTPTATTAVSVTGASGSPQLSTNPGRILAPESGGLADAFVRSRKPLVAEFTVGDRTLFVVGNHFTARSASGPYFGRMQPPPVGGADSREVQATIVGEFVGHILARDEDARVVVLGDFNDFYDSVALATLAEAGGESTLTNLVVAELPVEERYTYVFEGNSQALDHLLVSPALLDALVPGGFDIVHVNAEYAEQVSDHDPLVARFELLEP